MKKWNVKIEFTIQADDRMKAWELSREICYKHLRDLATVTAVSSNPLPDPEEWIAVNEPIKAQPVKVERIAATGEVVVTPLD